MTTIAIAETKDRTGEHRYAINLLQEFGSLEPEVSTRETLALKVRDLWQESSKFDVLFSDYTQGDVENFLDRFTDPRAVWAEVVRESDNRIVGSMFLTEVVRKFDAIGHFTFWDKVASGREPILWKALEWAFDRYDLHRITTTIPQYQSGLKRFIEKVGFILEGTRRGAVPHKGVWVNLDMYGILRSELELLVKEKTNAGFHQS